MNKNIIEQLKSKLIIRYQVDNNSLNALGGYQNFVYEFKKDNVSYVMRITDVNHRSVKEIEAELLFLEMLVENHVPVVRGIKLPHCDLIERFKTDHNEYLVVVFDKANGLTWTEFKTNDSTYYMAGKQLGKIHRISKTMKNDKQRENWSENQYLKDAYKVIPNQDILEKMEDLIASLNELQQSNDVFGLVHGDYNFANIIYNEDQLTIIDFDEAEYHWFIYDIAVYLFYYLLGGDPANMDKEPNIELFKQFMKGYLEENIILVEWIDKLPLFFRLREFILLSSVYRSNPKKTFHPWQKAYIESTEYRILNDIPFIDIDYVELFNDIKNK
ncbi:phosphotransferase [Mycoplasmatota bacterium]|nr:phosphotransferase [Mycoplasmatota bacterium]